MPKPICVVCKKEVEPTGYCIHENGLVHHIACTLTPGMEEELLDAQSPQG